MKRLQSPNHFISIPKSKCSMFYNMNELNISYDDIKPNIITTNLQPGYKREE